HLAAVHEPVGVVDAEGQRRDRPATLVRWLVAADHELLPVAALDLEPGARAPAGVGGIRALGDDAFAAVPAHLLEHARAVSAHVLAEMHRAARGQRGEQLAERLLAFHERESPQVPAVELEQVERPVLDGTPVGQRGLERRECRSAPGTARDDLTVDQRAVAVEAGERVGDLPEPVGPVEARARVADGLPAARRREATITVEFHLVQPVVAGGWLVDQCRELRRDETRGLAAALAPAPAPLCAARTVAGLVGGDLGQAATRRDAQRELAGQRVRVVTGVLVTLLDQQPVLAFLLRPRAHAHEHPAAAHALAVRHETQLALLECPLRVVLRGLPGAAVPQHHRAAAVLSLRDRAFELGVRQRMILGADGEPLLPGNRARPAGHRPAPKDPAPFEPQVVMQAARIVHLHEETRLPDAPAAASRGLVGPGLARSREIALFRVLVEPCAAGHGPQALFFLPLPPDAFVRDGRLFAFAFFLPLPSAAAPSRLFFSAAMRSI